MRRPRKRSPLIFDPCACPHACPPSRQTAGGHQTLWISCSIASAFNRSTLPKALSRRAMRSGLQGDAVWSDDRQSYGQLRNSSHDWRHFRALINIDSGLTQLDLGLDKRANQPGAQPSIPAGRSPVRISRLGDFAWSPKWGSFGQMSSSGEFEALKFRSSATGAATLGPWPTEILEEKSGRGALVCFGDRSEERTGRGEERLRVFQFLRHWS